MDALVRKYLDGELNETEALDFLDALASDPELSREVAELEQVVALNATREEVSVSPGFADRVMATIAAQAQPAVPARRRSSNWRGSWQLAASLVLAVGLGYILADGLPGPWRDAEQVAVTVTPGSGGHTSPQVVRLVYATAGSEVKQVGVAGSFNNWDPQNTPMRLENGVWVAMLMLPADSYEYMFVENNTTWVTDPLAQTTRDDGFGSRNAVLEVGI